MEIGVIIVDLLRDSMGAKRQNFCNCAAGFFNVAISNPVRKLGVGRDGLALKNEGDFIQIKLVSDAQLIVECEGGIFTGGRAQMEV